jgi:glutamate-1-semialdehyde 2,1-aminomutase
MNECAEINPNFVYDADDERVWREELDGFLPKRIFDFHGHVYLKSQYPPDYRKVAADPSQPNVVEQYPHEALAEVQRRLWPKREVRTLVFGSVGAKIDVVATNAYAAQAAQKYGWKALLVCPPTTDVKELTDRIFVGGFVGLKPYWTFVTSKAQNDVSIEDMVTPAMREVADRLGLIVTLHIPRAGRLADPININGLRRLCAEAPNAKIVLAHFGRSYFPEALGEGLKLADLENLYPEMSMVQDWEVYEAVFQRFDRKKILFGLDLPVAQEKGKLLGINGQRHFFTKRPHKWSVHAEPDGYAVHCTLFAYEMVRAAKKAMERLRMAPLEIEDYFWNNAERLLTPTSQRTR